VRFGHSYSVGGERTVSIVSKELKERSTHITSAKSCAAYGYAAKWWTPANTAGCLRRCSPSSSTASFCPTLPTLSGVALGFSVGLEYFLRAKNCWPGSKSGCVFWEAPGIGKLASEFESLDYPSTERKFNSYLADFRNVPLEKVRLHQHQGVEFIFVLKGRLALKVGLGD
jgi:hypothetical protein